MPTPEQVKRSRSRNRERYGEKYMRAYVRDAMASAREREAKGKRTDGNAPPPAAA